MTNGFQWHLDHILGHPNQQRPDSRKFALVVLNQPLVANDTFNCLWENAHLRLAADGGANRLYDSYHSTQSPSLDQTTRLDAIIGDLDSIRPSVKEYFTGLEPPTGIFSVPDQNSWDFEKVLSWLRCEHPDPIDVVIVGGLGGRVDHGLRQIHNLHLATPDPGYDRGTAFLLFSKSLSFILKPGQHTIHLEASSALLGQHVGILPAGRVSTVTTRGLEHDARELRLAFGDRVIISRILPGTFELGIVTSDPVLFTIDIIKAA
ncbi:thiamine pyrophosphokinase [Fusarium albosuccineum]|uniref:Thiamine pyrophosphokinase n=1 Tax=Fusarium albosuccineum TaxID=1237068 RepID=A0A8H4LQF6_9HYPO|nr:thiamine pyrophosphokinase [Fusarium albosuccineum]